MWFKFGDTSLDMSDVSNVSLSTLHGSVIVTMKGGQQIFLDPVENVSLESLYESITSLLEEMAETNDRYRENTFELFKKTLSELESISQDLKLISQNIRK